MNNELPFGPTGFCAHTVSVCVCVCVSQSVSPSASQSVSQSFCLSVCALSGFVFSLEKKHQAINAQRISQIRGRIGRV